MLNLTFSREKNRELSPLEARVGSLRRRLKDPLGRKNSEAARRFSASLRGQSVAMGGKRNRQRDAPKDWEDSGTDESYKNAPTSYHISELSGTGAVGERGHSNSSGQTGNRSGSGQSRQDKEGSQHKATLAPWTNAVKEALQGMSSAQQAINNLQEMFLVHMGDLSRIDEMRRRLDELEVEGREKDMELQKREHTISTLDIMDKKARAEIEHESAQLQKEKEELEQDKAKQAARIAVATAEERHSMKREFDQRTTKLNESHDARMKELEADFARRIGENSKRVTVLENENKQLSNTVQQHEETIKARIVELEDIQERYDILIRAKDSLRREKKTLETELNMMKQEFALDTKPVAYFEQRFADIYSEIEAISLKHFHGIEENDLEKVHKELVAADPCFRSVPIDDSDDSNDLRTAHAQRIISKAICEDIWKPFHSEFTLLHPELGGFLANISDNLDKSSRDGHTANVWTALTMRSLQSLPADTAISPGPESKQHFSSTGSVRADSVISKIFHVLGPLIGSPQAELLRTDLFAVVSSSIDVWDNAQAGDIKIIINPSLDRAHREEWRSLRFDPASTGNDENKPDLDLVSKTHPRVFTLFPRITAQIKDKLPPGSWPKSELTVINPGTGLPEWSSLVVRGKTEQEEKEDYLVKVMENAKKEFQSGRRLSGHARRGSKGSLTSGPPSPSAQWKMEGVMKSVET